MKLIRGNAKSKTRPTVGLVLGAGGVVGQAYQAGVLAGLERQAGWDPRDAELIVGTSAGSVTGAALRVGVPATDLAAMAVGRPLARAHPARIRGPPRPPSHLAAASLAAAFTCVVEPGGPSALGLPARRRRHDD